jgi:hypothetical protein
MYLTKENYYYLFFFFFFLSPLVMLSNVDTTFLVTSFQALIFKSLSLYCSLAGF